MLTVLFFNLTAYHPTDELINLYVSIKDNWIKFLALPATWNSNPYPIFTV